MTCIVLIGLIGASVAAAEEGKPWWHLNSLVRPSRIDPGTGTNEVQELKVAAGSGDVLVEGEGKKAVFAWDANAAEVQGVLETGLFGAGNVAVSGGPTLFGKGTLSAGTGTGGLTATSKEVKEVNTTAGAFAVGQEISGAGIPAETKIEAVDVATHTLTLSLAAEVTQGAAAGEGKLFGPSTGTGTLTEKSKEVKEVANAAAFHAGEEISGAGIPAGTTIAAVEPGGVAETLELSEEVEAGKSGSAVRLTSTGSPTVENVATTTGAFAEGQEISGPGIPSGTTIAGVEPSGPGTLALSAAATATGSHVALHAGAALHAGSNVITAATGLFSEGQEISGKGIPNGTTITKIGGGGTTITLSAPVTEAGSGVPLAVLAPYRVTFQGALSEQGPAPITNGGVSRQACHQTPSLGECLQGNASVTVATAAAPDGTLYVQAFNFGNASATGEATLRDVLPAGVSVSESGGVPDVFLGEEFDGTRGRHNILENFPEDCKVAGQVVTCNVPLPEGNPGELHPFEDLEMRIGVRVGASSEEERAEVSGGGASPVTFNRQIPVGGTPQFGVERFEQVPEELGGGVDAQAGSHPYQFTTTLALNQTSDPVVPPALERNLAFRLPPGFVGNTRALPQCSEEDFRKITSEENHCPPSTAIGVATLQVYEPKLGEITFPVPLFNLVPARGEPARFGFTVIKTPVTIDTAVRSGEDYGVTASASNISEAINFLSESVTFWGVPGEASHNNVRGYPCLARGEENTIGEVCATTAQSSPPPFLTDPTSCSEPFRSVVEGVSWPTKGGGEGEPQAVPLPAVPLPAENATTYKLTDGFGREIGLTGCNQLPFDPSIEAAPDVQDGSTPSGLKVDVKVPQEVSENSAGLSSSNVRGITVAFPAGMTLNPAGAGGLESCSNGQVGYTGEHEFESLPETKLLTFTGSLPEPLEPGLNLGAEGFCPNASKIGTVEIVSPLIANPVVGSLYLATQNQNPFGSLVASYIVAEDPVSGTLVKLPGIVALCKSAGEVLAGATCEAPGQIVSAFENQPQLPFETAEIHLFGGERAPLSTPARCGTYTTTAIFTPWSGSEPVAAHSSFNITSGPNGGPCPGAQLPFSPSLTGGATNLNAGAFSPLTATFGREDGEQNVTGATLHLPPGLSGILSTVKLCPEAQANEGTCGPESLVGETTVSAGVGNDPVYVRGGRIYITEKYHGAPFGLSIVDPVKTGPFDLEHDTANPAEDMPACDCIVVRGKIEIDPYTTALTITTNSESEGHAIPHMIDGIPVELKRINAITTRSGFQFNPTNCNPMALTATISGEEGGSHNLEVPFQVTNCKNLNFTPKFAVSTNAKTSKADGASLTATVSEPAGAFGTQANLTKVKVELPRDLPSRLTTLQKACTSKQFEVNPANCPKESDIGHAKVITPLLPVPLEGPAIFVSHGGEAFPSLTMVLQGAPPYDITIDLVGTTFISKSGVTSTTFKTVPDQPFNSFTLTLPTGKFSALTALGNVCNEKLQMPTEFIGQNGAELKQTTKIAVTGCKKTLTRAQKLKAALKACHKKHNKGKREACERTAHKRYGPVKKAKKGKGHK